MAFATKCNEIAGKQIKKIELNTRQRLSKYKKINTDHNAHIGNITLDMPGIIKSQEATPFTKKKLLRKHRICS